MSQRIWRFSRLIIFLVILLIPNLVFAQTTKWRYIQTIADGVKFYLKDDFQKVKGKNPRVWDKRVKPNGASGISLVEWDCKNKRYITREMNLYDADNKILGTVTKFEWSNVTPDTISELLYNQICIALPLTQFAEIVTRKANLRAAPNPDADVLLVAKKGDKFLLLEGMEQGGWYKVVDEKTQQDYWVYGNAIKIIEIEDKTNVKVVWGEKKNHK